MPIPRPWLKPVESRQEGLARAAAWLARAQEALGRINAAGDDTSEIAWSESELKDELAVIADTIEQVQTLTARKVR